ncbi:FAD-dependent oxidoreductase [Acrocarpospora macrocephala]|uniref:Pyridine nucleotide-disulfide oxidoreductase n=1 Tax=Acrocarpospora macrocephala TaxID=150177 RepID=A0A5M3WTW1_9ACTN|nr:FAD-dependent oxidoreductase [Acrocarpospora macrocephala]GES10701.1 pyridine nucleotide-disulfide oxidoreductase [Acrocarpospora macrocephala]
MTGVLIVGGSIAGVRTAEGLRRLSYEGGITILEAGPDLPYDRPALSKQLLAAGESAESVMLRSQADLDKAGIELRRGCRAVGLDVEARTVRLADGALIDYSDLVIATGSAPRKLPAAHGVHYLRTLRDALDLRDAIEGPVRVVVVGAGFIGSEVAAAATARSASVTVVEPYAFPLGRVLGDLVGKRLARLHESKGVQLILGRSVREVGADGAGGRRVVLDDGTTLDCDVVVVGIGATPRTGWLAGSGLDVADGVGCDEFCHASAPHVFAAGDVARWPNALFAEVMRIEHWTNAVEQAGVVAWNIVHPDKPRAYAPVPYVWSDQYGSRLQIVGRPRADDEVRIVLDDPADGSLVALYVRDRRLAGAFALNAPSQTLQLRRALAARAPLDEIMATIGVEY